jgi:hypothetical protein
MSGVDAPAPWRIAFDNARDPYTARNALGAEKIGGGGGGGGTAPDNAEYIVAVDDPTLTNDRVLTNTATVTWDFATAGQAKANATGFGNVSNSGTPAAGEVAEWVTATTIKGTAKASLGFVLKTGDTMTGDLTIAKASPVVVLDKPTSGSNVQFIGKTAGVPRWTFTFGDGGAESGGNAGSNFLLQHHTDAGGAATTFSIARATGFVTFSSGATIKGITDGSNAAAGYVGEYIENVGGSIVSAAVSVKALVGIAFPAGDWDVWGWASFTTATTGTRFLLSHSDTAGLDASAGRIVSNVVTPDGDCLIAMPIVRRNLTVTTFIYMVSFNAAAGTINSAKIMGRRVR